MKLKLLLCSTMFLLIGAKALPQSSRAPIKKINIDEKMPDFVLENMINFPNKSASFREFKGKLLILDFWDFRCSACIDSWPKLLKLQKQFKDDVQIILVNTKNTDKEVATFISKREKNLGIKMILPIACGDQNLNVMFPHTGLPHVIWINREGILKYVSSGNYLDAQRIEKTIKGEKLIIPEKNDYSVDAPFDYTKPFFVNGNGGNEEQDGKIIWSSMIKEFSPNFKNTMAVFGTYNGISCGIIRNYAVWNMFRILFGEKMNEYGMQTSFPTSRMIFRNVDTTKLVAEINNSFQDQNRYSIQLTAQKEISVEKLKEKMITEIEGYFGLKTYWEKQVKKCLVISRTKFPLTTYIEGKRTVQISQFLFNVNNISIKDFIDFLQTTNRTYACSPYPIIDETNFKGNLGRITFETNINNFMDVSEALNKHGIEFSIQDREVEILVITSNK